MTTPVSLTTDARDRAAMLFEQARQHYLGGRTLPASDLCREALTLDRDCLNAHLLLSTIALPGEYYLAMLRRLHEHLQPQTYLEIGVDTGDSIVLAGERTLAIGVDPAPALKHALRPAVRIIRETSDDFFGKHDVKAEFNGKPLDFAFIDGMHNFEFALRDFINIERNGTPETTVAIHDGFPLDEVTAARERTTQFWSGDIWKLTACLRKYRPDLSVHTLASPPTGLCLVRGLDPKSTVLPAMLDALYGEFVSMPLSALGTDKASALNLVPGDWTTARRLLSSSVA